MPHFISSVADETAPISEKPGAGYRTLCVVAGTLIALLAVSFSIQWYTREVSLARYCEDPAAVVARLEKIMTDQKPAGEGPRRAYVVTAKLVFLVPRGSGEALSRYLDRVRERLAAECG